MLASPARIELKSNDDSYVGFWPATFHKPIDPEAMPLRIFWGWNAREGWNAPANPRWAYRRKPLLYRLYVARGMASLNDPLESDPGIVFLRTWLPELDRGLSS